MSNNFKVGDIVELRSKSCDMTVIGFIDDGKVLVSWYGGHEGLGFFLSYSGPRIQRECFPSECLVLTSERKNYLSNDKI